MAMCSCSDLPNLARSGTASSLPGCTAQLLYDENFRVLGTLVWLTMPSRTKAL